MAQMTHFNLLSFGKLIARQQHNLVGLSRVPIARPMYNFIHSGTLIEFVGLHNGPFEHGQC